MDNLCDSYNLEGEGKGVMSGFLLLQARGACAQQEAAPREAVCVGVGIRTKAMGGSGRVWGTAARADC